MFVLFHLFNKPEALDTQIWHLCNHSKLFAVIWDFKASKPVLTLYNWPQTDTSILSWTAFLLPDVDLMTGWSSSIPPIQQVKRKSFAPSVMPWVSTQGITVWVWNLCRTRPASHGPLCFWPLIQGPSSCFSLSNLLMYNQHCLNEKKLHTLRAQLLVKLYFWLLFI